MPLVVCREPRLPQPDCWYFRNLGAPGSVVFRRFVSKKQKPILASRLVPCVDHRWYESIRRTCQWLCPSPAYFMVAVVGTRRLVPPVR